MPSVVIYGTVHGLHAIFPHFPVRARHRPGHEGGVVEDEEDADVGRQEQQDVETGVEQRPARPALPEDVRDVAGAVFVDVAKEVEGAAGDRAPEVGSSAAHAAPAGENGESQKALRE